MDVRMTGLTNRARSSVEGGREGGREGRREGGAILYG